ncbi:MAG: hypothetical protein IKP73_11835, partial [Bacteroidales bacterium]|nr:hypothetical protein [Bacteroidales bacterium]
MAKKEKKDVITRADGSVVKLGGYIASDNKSKAGFYKATLKASKLPQKVDLRSMMTAIESQGEIGSCTANAVAGAYEYLVRTTQGVDYDVSRLFIYYNARKSQGLEEEDSGAMIEWLMAQMSKKGACSEATWPYKTKRFTKKPPKEAYEEAKNYTITKYEHVATDLNTWKSVLAEGYPILFGIQIFPSFQTPRRGRISMPGKDEASDGGHAMCCVGYSDPDQVFIVRNSWGEQWGDGGYCYIPYDYMMSDKYNGGDSWVIYGADPVDIAKAEENWSDDDESVFVGMEDEFSDMDDKTWRKLCKELGDYDITYRLGALYAMATVGDDEVSEEEYAAATDKLATVLDMFGLNYDASEVMDYCAELAGTGTFIEETVEILGRYLSPGALATIAKDMYEIAAVDGLDHEEEQLIDALIGPWFNEELAEEYDNKYEERRKKKDKGGKGKKKDKGGKDKKKDKGGKGGSGKGGKGGKGKSCKGKKGKKCYDENGELIIVDDDDDEWDDEDDEDFDDDDLDLDDDD